MSVSAVSSWFYWCWWDEFCFPCLFTLLVLVCTCLFFYSRFCFCVFGPFSFLLYFSLSMRIFKIVRYSIHFPCHFCCLLLQFCCFYWELRLDFFCFFLFWWKATFKTFFVKVSLWLLMWWGLLFFSFLLVCLSFFLWLVSCLVRWWYWWWLFCPDFVYFQIRIFSVTVERQITVAAIDVH